MGALRITCLAAVLALVASVAVLAQSQEESELAAKRLQHRGEWILEFGPPETRAQDATAVFDELIATYPGAERVKWARLKKAQCLQYMRRYGDAAAICDDIIARWPGELVASWAQLLKGISFLRDWSVESPDYTRAYVEFLKVGQLYSHLDDQGAVVAAQGRLGEVLKRVQQSDPSGVSAAQIAALAADEETLVLTLGASITAPAGPSDSTRTELASAVAQFEALSAAHPSAWKALGRVALSIGSDYMSGLKHGDYASTMEDAVWLRYILGLARSLDSADTYTVARATLALAEFEAYSASRNPGLAVDLLRQLRQTGPPPDIGPVALWRLAGSLQAARQTDAAIEVLTSLVAAWPDSEYCWAARHELAGIRQRQGDFAAGETLLSDILAGDYAFNSGFYALERLAQCLREAGESEKERDALQRLVDFTLDWATDARMCSSVELRGRLDDTIARARARLAEMGVGGEQ